MNALDAVEWTSDGHRTFPLGRDHDSADAWSRPLCFLEVSVSSPSLATSADGRGGAFADGGCAFGAEALRWAASQHLATRFVIRQSPPPVQTVIPVPGAAKGLERGLRGWPEVGRACPPLRIAVGIDFQLR